MIEYTKGFYEEHKQLVWGLMLLLTINILVYMLFVGTTCVDKSVIIPKKYFDDVDTAVVVKECHPWDIIKYIMIVDIGIISFIRFATV